MKMKSLLAFITMFFIGSAWLDMFVVYVLPAVYPLFLEGRFWAVWLIAGVFVAPLGLLIGYICIVVTGSLWMFDRTQWKIALIGTPLVLLYLTAFAFIFSLFIPSDFEAFRSIALPAIVLALTLIVFGRTKYAKRWQLKSDA